MATGQQLDEPGSLQGIEPRMAEARQRFREELLRLLRLMHLRFGEELSADAEHAVAAAVEQRIATCSLEELEIMAHRLSKVRFSPRQSSSATPSGLRPVPVSPDSTRNSFLDWLQGFIEPFAD